MINEETIKVTGLVTVELFGPDGKIKEQTQSNLVTTVGKQFIVSRMFDTSQTVMNYMSVGTSTTAAAVGDTTLGAEISGSRTANTSNTYTGTTGTYVCTLGAGVGTGAVTEAGIFNASSAGTMLAHTVFSVVNKGALDSMSITWAITIS
jgi:hypothetical protein